MNVGFRPQIIFLTHAQRFYADFALKQLSEHLLLICPLLKSTQDKLKTSCFNEVYSETRPTP